MRFGAVASTLIVEPGAVFNGQVAANGSVNDVLQLNGTESVATPITLGTQVSRVFTPWTSPAARPGRWMPARALRPRAAAA